VPVRFDTDYLEVDLSALPQARFQNPAGGDPAMRDIPSALQAKLNSGSPRLHIAGN
jgi:hypothetical protein